MGAITTAPKLINQKDFLHHGAPDLAQVPRLRGFGLRAALTFFWRKNGDLIPIEEREPAEVVCFAGHQLGPEGVAAFNPAFDITPAKYMLL